MSVAFHPGPLVRSVTPASSSPSESSAIGALTNNAPTPATPAAIPHTASTPNNNTTHAPPNTHKIANNNPTTLPSPSIHQTFLTTGGSLTYHLLLKKHKALPRSFVVSFRLSSDLNEFILTSNTFHPLTLTPIPLGDDPGVLKISLYDLVDSCVGVYDCTSVMVEKHVRKAGMKLQQSFTMFLAHTEHRNKLAIAYAPPLHHYATAVNGFPLPFYFEAGSPESASQWLRALAWAKQHAATTQHTHDRRAQLLRMHHNSNLQSHSHSQSLSLTSLNSDPPTPVLVQSSHALTSIHPPHQPSHQPSAFSFMGDAIKRAFHHHHQPSTSLAANQTGTGAPHTISPFQHVHAELTRAQLQSEQEEYDLTLLQQQSIIPSSASSSSSSASTPSAAPTPTGASTKSKVDQLTTLLSDGQAFLSFTHGRSLTQPPDLLFLWTTPDLGHLCWSGERGLNGRDSTSTLTPSSPDQPATPATPALVHSTSSTRSKPLFSTSTSSIAGIEAGIQSTIFGLDKWVFTLTLRVASNTPSSTHRTIFEHLRGGASGRGASFSGPTNITPNEATSNAANAGHNTSNTLVTLHLAVDSCYTLQVWLFALKWLRDYKSNVGTPYNVQRVAWMDTNLTWGGDNLFKVFGIDSKRENLIKLGGGGMANVYLITHHSTRQHFALKVFHHYPEIILHEIEIMKELSHPNCIAYFGCIPKGLELYVIMEYAELGSLADLLTRSKEKLKEQHIAFILKQVLHALQYLHSLSILHRDIKAANILLTAKGQVKLTDFGISDHFVSKSVSGSPPGLDAATGASTPAASLAKSPPASRASASTPIAIGGSPLWMSPEALRGHELHPAADVWSLGITAIEIAEGRPPNSDLKSILAVAHAVFNNPSPALLTHARSFANPSEHFIDFVDRCLCKSPESRWTVDQLLSHPFILAAHTASGAAASSTSTPSSSSSSSTGASGVVASAKSLLMRGAQLLTQGFSTPTTHPHTSANAATMPPVLTLHDRNNNAVTPSPVRQVGPSAGNVSVSTPSASASPQSSKPSSPAQVPTNIANKTMLPPTMTLQRHATPSPAELCASPPDRAPMVGGNWPVAGLTAASRSAAGTPTHTLLSSSASDGSSEPIGLAAAAKQYGSLHGSSIAALMAKSTNSSPHLSPSGSMNNLHAYTLASAALATGHAHTHSLSTSTPFVADEPDEAFVSFLTHGTYARARFPPRAGKAASDGSTPSVGVGVGAATGGAAAASSSRASLPAVATTTSDSAASSSAYTSSDTEWEQRYTNGNANTGGASTLQSPPTNPRLLKKQSGERQLMIETDAPHSTGSGPGGSASASESSSGSSLSSPLTGGSHIATQDPRIQLSPPALLVRSHGDKRLHLRGQSHGPASQELHSNPRARMHQRQFSKLPKLQSPLTLKRMASMSTVEAFEKAAYDADEDSLPPTMKPGQMTRGVTSPPINQLRTRAASVIPEGDEDASATATPHSRSHAIMRKYSSAMPFSRVDSGGFLPGMLDRQFTSDSTGGLIERQLSSASSLTIERQGSDSIGAASGNLLEPPSAGCALTRQVSAESMQSAHSAVPSPRSLQRDTSYSHSYVTGPPAFLKPLALTAKERFEQGDDDDDEPHAAPPQHAHKPSLHIMSSTSEIEAEDDCPPLRTFASGADDSAGDGDTENSSDGNPFAIERATLMRQSSLNQGDGGGRMGDMNASYVISSHGTLIAGNFAISAQGLHAQTPADGPMSRRSSVLDQMKKARNNANATPNNNPHMTSASAVSSDTPTSVHTDDHPEVLTSPTHHDHALSKADLFTLGVIGKGQNGPVLKAIHLPSLTRVALKSIYAHDRGTRHQLLHELTAYLHFDSPYLVSFLGAYYEDSVIGLATEYMDQGSLQHFIRRNGCLLTRPRVFKQIAYQCIAGLKHMHDHHALHRDIKPDNVLLDHHGQVKVADFGLLKELGSTLNMSNTFLGTMSYLSPERIRSEPYSYPADIWSMGQTFIYALTGKMPTASSDFFTMMDLITNHPPEKLSPESHGLEPDLCDWVNGMLKMEPQERYTCEQLLNHPFIRGSECVDSDSCDGAALIPQTHLVGDVDSSVWSVSEANQADLDLILELMISNHLLPELEAKQGQPHSLDSMTPHDVTHTSHGEFDSSSPILTSTDGAYTTSLHSHPASKQPQPTFRLPAHILNRGASNGDGEQREEPTMPEEEEEEISIIQTFPVEINATNNNTCTNDLTLNDGVTDPAQPTRPSLPLHAVAPVDDDTDDSDDDGDDSPQAPLSLRQMTFTRTESQNRWFVDESSNVSSSTTSPAVPLLVLTALAPPATLLRNITADPPGAETHLINTGVEEDEEEEEEHTKLPAVESDEEEDTPMITAPTAATVATPSTDESTDAAPRDSSTPTPVLDVDGDAVDGEDACSSSSPPRFGVKLGLSLHISPLESIEDTDRADIAVMPVDPPLADTPTITVSTRPRLSMNLGMVDSSLVAADDESTIPTFASVGGDDTGTGAATHSRPGSIFLSPNGSAGGATPHLLSAGMELLPLDPERCDCLAWQFGVTPEQVQHKWNEKQREMIAKMQQ